MRVYGTATFLPLIVWFGRSSLHWLGSTWLGVCHLRPFLFQLQYRLSGKELFAFSHQLRLVLLALTALAYLFHMLWSWDWIACAHLQVRFWLIRDLGLSSVIGLRSCVWFGMIFSTSLLSQAWHWRIPDELFSFSHSSFLIFIFHVHWSYVS